MGAVQVPDDARKAELTRMMQAHGGALAGLCTAMLKDAHLAQDMVQETFIRAYAKMEGFRGEREGSERAWLSRIAINLCRDYQRTSWFRLVDRREMLERTAGAEAAPDDGISGVLEVVESLPPRLREAVLLYYYQDMRLEEAAQVLGVGKSTMSRRLNAARKKLRQSLEGWDFNE